MIAITLDIDWAPEAVIKDSLNLFEKYEVKCTLFATHYSPFIDQCNRNLFEVSIHPNFNDLIDGKAHTVSASMILDELIRIYPEAKGVRSHSMTQSSKLLALFKSKGLLYDSNQFIPYNFNMKPYKCWTGIKRIPYNWEDDIHFAYGKKFDFNFGLIYNEDENYIFDFHPVHIYLNTDCQGTYDKAKIYYHDAEGLKKCRNTGEQGVRNYLENLLKFIVDKNIQTKLLSEI